jgi:hypothetical protein
MMDAYLPVAEARLITRCVQRTTAYQLFPSLLTLFVLSCSIWLILTPHLHLCRMELLL